MDGAAPTEGGNACRICSDLSSTGDGYYYIVNNNSRKKAVQWACGNYGDQHWSLIVYYSMLKTRTSGKCLVIRLADTQASTYDCHAEYADQWWYRA